MSSYKSILVPTDGSKLSLKAAREAATLAKSLKAKLTAIYVMPQWIPPMLVEGTGLPAEAFDERAFNKATEATARTALDKVEEAARAESVMCESLAVRDDEPWKGIVKSARKCDLIVMASHGRTGIEAVILGSETRKVLSHANKPVLVVH
jgi:nucleotide-binding universal stress UspA family protein